VHQARKLLGHSRGVASRFTIAACVDEYREQVVGMRIKRVDLLTALRQDPVTSPAVLRQFAEGLVAFVERPRQPNQPVERRPSCGAIWSIVSDKVSVTG